MPRNRWRAAGLIALIALGLVAGATDVAAAGGRDPRPTRDRTEVPQGLDTIDDLRDPYSHGEPPRPQGDKAPVPQRPDVIGDEYSAGEQDRHLPVKDGCVNGQFQMYSYEWNDWLGAWGWTVELWAYDSTEGSSEIIASERIELDENGEWQYCLNGLAGLGSFFLYGYEAKNELMDIYHPAGQSSYRWTPFPLDAWPPQTGMFGAPQLNVEGGGMVLDTDHLSTGAWTGVDGNGEIGTNQDYGLNDIMRWAMSTLTKVQEETPLDPAPWAHRIRYPEMDEDCKVACHKGGEIYLPLKRSQINPYVVRHEIGHSLVYRHWGKSGTGGTHLANACGADTGQALSEGIANFIALWTEIPDRTQDPVDAGIKWPFSIEEPHDDCDDGSKSEEWVAGALWDLHDKHDDGDGRDWTGMEYDYGILALVLAEPYDNIVDLWHTFRADHLDFSGWIDDVFEMNKIKD